MLNASVVSGILFTPTLALAVFFGFRFFRTRNGKDGLLNDTFSALVLLLLIFPALSLAPWQPDWFNTLTKVTVAGMIVGATGQILLVLRLIKLNTSFITGGLAILPILAWYVGINYLSFSGHLGGVLIGWLGLASLVLGIVSTILWRRHVKISRSVLLVMFASLACWTLAISL